MIMKWVVEAREFNRFLLILESQQRLSCVSAHVYLFIYIVFIYFMIWQCVNRANAKCIKKQGKCTPREGRGGAQTQNTTM